MVWQLAELGAPHAKCKWAAGKPQTWAKGKVVSMCHHVYGAPESCDTGSRLISKGKRNTALSTLEPFPALGLGELLLYHHPAAWKG